MRRGLAATGGLAAAALTLCLVTEAAVALALPRAARPKQGAGSGLRARLVAGRPASLLHELKGRLGQGAEGAVLWRALLGRLATAAARSAGVARCTSGQPASAPPGLQFTMARGATTACINCAGMDFERVALLLGGQRSKIRRGAASLLAAGARLRVAAAAALAFPLRRLCIRRLLRPRLAPASRPLIRRCCACCRCCRLALLAPALRSQALARRLHLARLRRRQGTAGGAAARSPTHMADGRVARQPGTSQPPGSQAHEGPSHLGSEHGGHLGRGGGVLGPLVGPARGRRAGRGRVEKKRWQCKARRQRSGVAWPALQRPPSPDAQEAWEAQAQAAVGVHVPLGRLVHLAGARGRGRGWERLSWVKQWERGAGGAQAWAAAVGGAARPLAPHGPDAVNWAPRLSNAHRREAQVGAPDLLTARGTTPGSPGQPST